MRFDWDETKDANNPRKHGFGFEAASLVFDDPLQLSAQDREVDGEERWQTIGMAGACCCCWWRIRLRMRTEKKSCVLFRRGGVWAKSQERRRYEDGI